MKKALLILHQKRSVAGDIEIKLRKRGFELDFCRPPLGQELPSSLDEYSLVVIFGGPMSANDEDDFILKEINFMKLIIDTNTPYLGICLGAQFLAKYLGSTINLNENRLSEIGFYKIQPTIEGKKLFKNHKNIKIVQEAMFSSTNERFGTSYKSRIDDPKYQFAGKTGTAQVKRISKRERELDLELEQIPYKDRDHALYVAYGPYINPRYALSIIVEHGGSGSKAAAPIAKKLFKLIIDRHDLRNEQSNFERITV